MKFFYRCAVCKTGFWYDKEIGDNNLECLHCQSSGYEETYDEGMGKVVPKLHRIQVATNKEGGVELPSYSFECTKCGHKFGVYSGMSEIERTRCRECKAPYEELVQVYGVPHIIHDISHSEGRTGHEDLDMSHVFGEGARISSRAQLKEYKRLTRDRYFQNTDKHNRVLKPFRNPDTGKIEMEYVTHKGVGVDLGEIHEMDDGAMKAIEGKAKSNEAKDEREWTELEKKAAAQVKVAD